MEIRFNDAVTSSFGLLCLLVKPYEPFSYKSLQLFKFQHIWVRVSHPMVYSLLLLEKQVFLSPLRPSIKSSFKQH